MGINNKGNLGGLKSRFRVMKSKVDDATFLRLSKLGEELVNYARSIPAEIGYTDQTGNLRSSTGYIIVKDGAVRKVNFTTRKGRSSQQDGKTAGYQHAISVASNHSNGYTLIVVAGMEYALAVESKGRDVLTSTEYLANERLPVEVNRLREQIKKMRL